jgi:superfamily I DNA/RNA helicase
MLNQFNENPIWTEEQKSVIASNPNLIITGCAGSGKTLLACHLAIKYSKEYTVAILVFTKSLKSFIEQWLTKAHPNNISVLYHEQWKKRNYQQFDIIIVDEFQDFSMNDIIAVVEKARKGVFLFGDTEQKLYEKNLMTEPTVDILELKNKTNFPRKSLTENLRVSKENVALISSFFMYNSLRKSSFFSGFKPKILSFETIEDELNWIKDFIVEQNDFHNIAILLKQNDSFKGAYYKDGVLQKDVIYGVMELKEYLENENIIVGYKHYSKECLIFSENTNINIMTCHSSKGLQFDCVILPFSNYVNDNNGRKNLPYVALTRVTEQLIITYSGRIADEYSVDIPLAFFEGTIYKKTTKDDMPLNEQVRIMILENKIKVCVNSVERAVLEEELRALTSKIDTSDCKIVKY